MPFLIPVAVYVVPRMYPRFGFHLLLQSVGLFKDFVGVSLYSYTRRNSAPCLTSSPCAVSSSLITPEE